MLAATLAWVAVGVGCEDFEPPEGTEPEPAAERKDAGSGPSSSVSFDGGMDASERTAEDAGQDAAAVEPGDKRLNPEFTMAQGSDDFVFVPDPKNHSVWIVDPLRLGVRQRKDLGRNPSFLAADQRSNTVVVIDEGEGEARVVRASSAAVRVEPEPPDPAFEVPRFANAVQFAPDGDHALVYHSPQHVGAADTSDSFHQEVAVLRLEAGEEKSVLMTVGLKPREVFFGEDGLAAYLPTDSGISVLTFAEIFPSERDTSPRTIARIVDFGHEIAMDQIQVTFTSWGRYVLGFEAGHSKLHLLDTATAEVWSLDFADLFITTQAAGDGRDAGVDDDAGMDPVVDAGITPKWELAPGQVVGISDVACSNGGIFALVALPGPKLVLKVPLPKTFQDQDLSLVTTVAENEENDSVVVVPADGNRDTFALLYDKKGGIPRATLVDLRKLEAQQEEEEQEEEAEEETDEQTDEQTEQEADISRRVMLGGPIDSVAFAEEGETALIFHPQRTVEGQSQVGYSMLNVEEGLARYFATGTDPGPFALSHDAQALFMMVRDDDAAVREVHRVLYSNLLNRVIELERKPRRLGLVPGVERVFVDEEHPEGRITIMNYAGTITGSLTGFQLVDRIRE